MGQVENLRRPIGNLIGNRPFFFREFFLSASLSFRAELLLSPSATSACRTGWIERAAEKMPEEEYVQSPIPPYCNRAYDTLTDANANESVKAFGQERNKLGVLWFNASHNLEHCGNLVVYMRLKGIVPPSSDPNPQ